MMTIHALLHFNLYLAQYLQQYGTDVYVLLFLMIFCETGVVIMPFLPGDSLLFAVGSLFATAHFNVHTLVPLLILAAVCGDNCNYWIGCWLGPHVFHDQNRWLKKEYLQKTHRFYEQYGAKAIILARFIPIVRTCVPFVAGIGKMQYGQYLLFCIIGATLWIAGITYIGYYFGNIPWVQQHFSSVVAAIIVISILPALIEWQRNKILQKRQKAV